MNKRDIILSEYLNLFDRSISSFTLQSAMGLYLDVEVNLLAQLVLTHNKAPKVYSKIIPKFARGYLLDTFDANTKTRCMFAWSG